MLFKFKLFALITIFISFHERSQAEPKVESSQFSGKQSQDWTEIQTKLAALKGKVDSQQAIVEELILQKEHLKGDELSKKIELIKLEHQKLQQQIVNYNELNKTYQTKFPEKGLKEPRIYKRIDPQSIEHIENDMTLDGRLVRLYQKVLKQYPDKTKKVIQVKKKLNEAPAPSKEAPPLSKDSNGVTDQIILQK